MSAIHSTDVVARLADEFGAAVSFGTPLAAHTTLRLGGPAAAIVTCTTTDMLAGVVRRLDQEQVPVLILAGGSNLVIADEGVDAVVVRVAATSYSIDGAVVHAEAGTNWDTVVAASVVAGLGGLECLSGIPGSTGATPVQNVGAYGVEISSVLRRVKLLERASGNVHWADPADLHLSYRHSILKNTDTAVVLSVEMGLLDDGLSAPVRYGELARNLGAAEGDRVAAAQVRDAVLKLRGSKGMVLNSQDHDTWSAGSFFTNPIVSREDLPRVLAAIRERLGEETAVPQFASADGGVKLSAGWLIERAGFSRGFPGEDARARLSTKHTLALTNRGDATTADLVGLARTVRDGVRDAFGVNLHPEPVFVGAQL
ncbi:UDP-N-acetylmuramate dehydrogenase [Hoyosella subflava]|uniref:UDP-N-acetylenolpyruvoylglucosamine reductase n=1 Tax=Hoyosella subflava (strain DSM 45089 / JCM 17490 / NBRC 109087 / DQS3-9A1) TaxID=443218 RepID=F6EJM5_HOYSD|nr:UDP-N-acetylenolpyruvoylglucosamine reductase [Hoyosella subflava DQS3-9A1]